ncbi:hypothetical protein FHS21_001253 [Phyllobacterium trifolii]|jgi:hypothetical protein|uniref:Uncharacterized protein n=1 Tax=Phyllobacterium trifolii TaxID=300193 RepID=A0A839U789_9HYPH|nr:hypothetical protein [Phyllobacterium trifolii]
MTQKWALKDVGERTVLKVARPRINFPRIGRFKKAGLRRYAAMESLSDKMSFTAINWRGFRVPCETILSLNIALPLCCREQWRY